jgi:hypothetical protein
MKKSLLSIVKNGSLAGNSFRKALRRNHLEPTPELP